MELQINRKRASLAAVVTLVALSSLSLNAAVPGYPSQGRWSPGPTVAIEHLRVGAESVLLAGEGTGLMILDAADPTDMTVLGRVDTGGPVWEIAVSDDGQTAAVSDRDDWMTLVDISDRSAPVVLGRYEFISSVQPWGVDLEGDLAYVAVRGEGLWVVDITDPAQMSRVGRYLEIGTVFVPDVEVLGDYAFLADDQEGVAVIDISDPTTPTLANRFLAADLATEITLDGTIAYVSRKSDGLTILDLSAAPAITELGTIVPGGLIYSTAVVGPGLVVCADGYLGSAYGGLYVIDVSNPAVPVVVGTQLDSVTDVTTDGTTAFAIRLYDVEPPTLYAHDIDITAPFDPPIQVGTLPLAGENVDVAVADDIVLVANERGGAFVVDASDASRPQTLARIDVDGARADRIARVGSMVAYVSFSGSLGLVDLSNPQNPSPLNDYQVAGGNPRDIVKIPGVTGLAVAADDDGVRIIDLSNPTAPVEVGHWVPPTGFVYHVDQDGDRIAAAGGTNVWVLNASALSAPFEWTSFTVPANVLDVAVEGDHVFVAISAFSVLVWDVSVAGSPMEVATIDISPTNANGLEIHADRLYIAADAWAGLMVRDITNPTDPFEIDTADTPGRALSVAASGTLIAVADGIGGVEIWSSVQVSEVLFADGFESGDTAEWGATAP